MSDTFITENKPDHHYRTETPNILWKLGLSIEAISVYNYLKMIAGDDGACWKSQKTIMYDLKLSLNTYLKYRKELTQSFTLLGGKSLIHVQKRFKDNGKSATTKIHIINIWKDSGDYFRNEKKIMGSKSEPMGSKYEHKQDPLEQDLKEQQQSSVEKDPSTIEDRGDVVVSSEDEKKRELIKPLGLNLSVHKLALTFTLLQIQKAVDCAAHASEMRDINAYITSALKCNWKPNYPKEIQEKIDEEAKEQAQEQKRLNEKKKIHVEIKKIIKANKDILKEGFELIDSNEGAFAISNGSKIGLAPKEGTVLWLNIWLEKAIV